MALTRFDPPGLVDDLGAAQRDAWSDWVAQQLDDARARDGGRPQFFNELSTPVDADKVEKDITWTAFPRIVKIGSVGDAQRWKRADGSRDRQDEYCEWSVTRDPASGKVTRVTFTSEGPEYWQFLAAVNPAKVLALYQMHVDPAVKKQDLFDSHGGYNPRNRWNDSTDGGAMHLIQRNNTLGAEIELAAAATIVRRKGGVLLTNERELIDCAQYGAPERFSDPKIGSEVNAVARQKADITLANPVGLCIAGLSVATWQTPDGSDPASYWKITRGSADKSLRAIYEVPPAKNFVVGDIEIDGRQIEFGAQIADFITIKLTGLATRFGKSTAGVVDGCVGGEADAVAMDAPPPSVASVISQYEHPRR